MRILIGIDSSPATAKAIRFVGDLLSQSKSPDVWITLLHVTESVPDQNLSPGIPQSLGSAYQAIVDEAKAGLEIQGERLLEKDAAALQAFGISSDHISTKLKISSARPESSKVATALGIIQEMHTGHYDVVCVGRRGTSAAEGAFVTSIAEKVLSEARGLTVWVVD